jgi:hypothetical protein
MRLKCGVGGRLEMANELPFVDLVSGLLRRLLESGAQNSSLHNGSGSGPSYQPPRGTNGVGTAAAVQVRQGVPARPTQNRVIPEKSSIVFGPASKNPAQILFERTNGYLTATVTIQKPMVRETIWDLRDTQIRLLAFPYCIFVVGLWREELAKIYIYYSNSMITSLNDSLYMSNLPNVYVDDSCCLGDGAQVEELRQRVRHLSHDERIKRLVDEFWRFAFNGHMVSNRFKPIASQEPRLRSLEVWEENSRVNRGFILSVDWQRACTVNQAIERCLHNHIA